MLFAARLWRRPVDEPSVVLFPWEAEQAVAPKWAGREQPGPWNQEGYRGSAPDIRYQTCYRVLAWQSPGWRCCFTGTTSPISRKAAEKPFVNHILKEVLNSLGYSLSTELCKMSQMENKVASVSTGVRARASNKPENNFLDSQTGPLCVSSFPFSSPTFMAPKIFESDEFGWKGWKKRGLQFERYGPNAFGLVSVLGWGGEPTVYCPSYWNRRNLPSFLQQRKDVQNIGTEYEVFS